jgi:hypothetical protein
MKETIEQVVYYENLFKLTNNLQIATILSTYCYIGDERDNLQHKDSILLCEEGKFMYLKRIIHY